MKIIVLGARLSFHDLFQAKSIRNGAPRFNATLICLDGTEKDNPKGFKTLIKYKNVEGENVVHDYSKLDDICKHILKEKFKKITPKMKNWCYNKADGSTTRDEYTNEDGDFWAGFNSETFYISATKKEENGKPKVLNQLKKEIDPNSGDLFSGCYVNAVIDVYAFDNKEDKGVSASLEGIQLKATGEPLGVSIIDAAEDFEEEEIDDIDEAGDLI
jgi:hypothetical protein